MVEEKENVGVETASTEEIAKANGAVAHNQETLSVLGKFKDVDALAKAYGSLQAEFTRRSQRLKELERQAENFNAQTEKGEEQSGAEKLRKKAELKKVEERAFDEFVSELEQGGENRGEGEENNALEPLIKKECVLGSSGDTDMPTSEEDALETSAETALGLERDATVGLGREPAVAVSSDDLYQRVSRDENVRLRIIGEYLSSLGKVNAPLMRGGASTLASPPLKAKSIDEAGGMALRYFKKQ